MRNFAFCVGLICSWVAVPATAQWLPAEPLTFVQGSTNNELEVQVPVPPGGISGFEGMNVSFTYDGTVFAPIELTRIPTSNDGYFDFASSFLGAPAPGCSVCVVTLSLPADPVLSFPFGAEIPGPGILYHARVRFDVLSDAPLGLTTVTAAFSGEENPLLSGTLPVQATIVPVPEPSVWLSMVAGLALVGLGVGRRRLR